MSDLAISLTTPTKIYTVNLESVAYPDRNFTILIPGWYTLSETKEPTEKNVFENPDISKLFEDFFTITEEGKLDFGFDLNGVPLECTTYDAITKYINVLIGSEYCAILGREYVSKLKNLFRPTFKDLRLVNIEDSVLEQKVLDYDNIIEDMSKFADNVIDNLTVLNKSKEDLLHNFEINKTTVTIKDTSNLSTSDHIKFDYDQTPTTYEFLVKTNFVNKVDNIILVIMNQLAKSSELSMYVYENSYREFIGQMLKHMFCNPNIVNYKSSIMNYSIFRWMIGDNYPYNTPSRIIYSIRDTESKNKISNVYNRINNIDSFVKFMYDTFALEQLNPPIAMSKFDFQVHSLKKSLSLLCALLGIKSELIAISKLELGEFTDKIIERNPLRTSRRYLK